MDDLNNRINQLKDILIRVWSIESSSKWTPTNPALGQCGVTALVTNDIFGGEILKTKTPDGYHFYNQIGGEVFDLTESQFAYAVEYKNIVSSREEAFLDTNETQYNYLKESVYENLFKNQQ